MRQAVLQSITVALDGIPTDVASLFTNSLSHMSSNPGADPQDLARGHGWGVKGVPLPKRGLGRRIGPFQKKINLSLEKM